jgi:hypothetical protein
MAMGPVKTERRAPVVENKNNRPLWDDSVKPGVEVTNMVDETEPAV